MTNQNQEPKGKYYKHPTSRLGEWIIRDSNNNHFVCLSGSEADAQQIIDALNEKAECERVLSVEAISFQKVSLELTKTIRSKKLIGKNVKSVANSPTSRQMERMRDE